MSNKTLREKYTERHLQEAKRTMVILEALDAEKIGAISKALDNLERLIPRDKMSGFFAAFEAAKIELGKASSGGIGTSIKQKLTQPISKAVTLADSLKAAFKLTPQLIKSFIDPQYSGDITSPIDQIIPDAKKQQFIKAFLNAARPVGLVASLGKLFSNSSGIPFVTNAETAVAEMMQNMSVTDLNTLSRSVSSTQETIPPEVAKELQTTNTTSSTPTSGTDATQSTTGTEATKQDSAHPEAFNYIKSNIDKLSSAQKKELLDTLSKQV